VSIVGRPSLPVRAWRFYQRQGLRVFLRRTAEFLRPQRSTIEAVRQQLPGVDIAENEPDSIEGHVDTPRNGLTEWNPRLSVTGWLASADGIERAGVYIDGMFAGVDITTGLARADVGELLRRIPGAANSGFATEVDIAGLQEGPHRLQVVVFAAGSRRRILDRVFYRMADENLYDTYYAATLPSPADVAKARRAIEKHGSLPQIDLWVIVDGIDGLAATLQSIREQEYSRWQCTVVSNESDRENAAVAIARVAGDDLADRFMLHGAGVAEPSAERLGDYAAILSSGETLATHALATLVARAQQSVPDVIYSDHDSIDESGRHVSPWLNPDWSPDYVLARDYVGGFFLFRDPGGAHISTAMENARRSAWRYDLLLRLTDGDATIAHVPEILWSTGADARDASTVEAAEITAVTAALDRRRRQAQVIPLDKPRLRRVRWHLAEEPKVSIIIPTTGDLQLLEPCVTTMQEKTTYRNYELLFIDNSHGKHPEGIAFLRSLGCTVLERDEPFNWAKLNNDGARASTGELLLFLNDDMEITEGDWLTELVSQANRPEIGAVGALLLYPSGLIQHAGVFLVGHGGGAIHVLRGSDPSRPIYGDLHQIAREVSAVTGACMMVSRAKFEALSGFDESLEVVGNDIDLCLRLLRNGYRNLFTPYSSLIHHESASRRDTAVHSDETRVWQLWGDLLRDGDPYHSRHMAKDRPDLSLSTENLPTFVARRRSASAGINLIAYIHAEMGLGEAARGMAQALSEAGVPTAIIDYRHGNPSRMADETFSQQTTDQPKHDVNLIHINADLLPDALTRLPPDLRDGRYTIGYWTWELPEFPDKWLGSFDLVDEVWVPSTFVLDAVSRKSPVPVVRIPHAITVPTGPFMERRELGLPEEPYLFLTMYDVHSVRERKNPDGAIEAFKTAFPGGDDRAALVVKVNNADEAERRVLARLVGDAPNIHTIDRVLSRHEVTSLIAATDCFVSLHRSEGFGLAIAEAMALARPVIATYWSGNVDFMNASTAACIGYRLATLEQDYGPYRAGSTWAEPDIDQAADWMRRLATAPESGHALGTAAHEAVKTLLSPAAVGARAVDRLARIRAARARPSGYVGRAA
jgi:GT2 family glycosyltransferase